MNHSPFWPLVWKEYRTSRAFWLAMAVMGLVAQAGVYLLVHFSVERNVWLHRIALMMSAGFAVGIGGTLFAVEHEERTIALLRTLPVRARQLGLAKILAALAGLIALVAVLWLAAGMMADWQPLPLPQAGNLWRTWGLASLEGLAWGVLCSLIIRRPLQATVLAAMSVALVDYCAVLSTAFHDFSPRSYAQTIPYRTAVLLLVALADVLLVPGWLAGRRLERRQKSWRQLLERRRPGWWRPLRHLIWQTVRDARTGLLVLLIAAPLVFYLVNDADFSFRVLLFNGHAEGDSNLLPTLSSLVLLAALNGCLVFRADQVHGPRFLAGQGVSSRTVWFSRQLVWGCWLWGLVAIAAGFFAALLLSAVVRRWFGVLLSIDQTSFFSAVVSVLLTTAWALRFLLPAYAAGQLASLFMRGSLLAAVLGIGMGALAALWARLMLGIGAAWWWSVLPIVAGMFLATWLRMSGWLIERSSLRNWIGPAAAALVPAAALSIAAPAYRVLQIPVVHVTLSEPTVSPAADAAARGTLDLYSKAWDLYLANRQAKLEQDDNFRRSFPLSEVDPLSEEDEVWAKPVVDQVIAAGRRDASLLVLPITERRAAIDRLETMESFLMQFASQQQRAGNLNTALDVLLATFRVQTQLNECDGTYPPLRRATFRELRSWSAARGQKTGWLLSAIKRLKECHAEFPAPEDWLLSAYEETELSINDLEAAARAGIVAPNQLHDIDWLLGRMPWERARARRALDLQANWQIHDIQKATAAMAKNLPVELTYPLESDLDELPSLAERDARTVVWEPTPPLVVRRALLWQPVVWQYLCQETEYRATLITLALEAFRLDHNWFPQELTELVGAQLEELPLDPLWARSFLYYKEGSADAWSAQSDGREKSFVSLRLKPFLWSALNERSYNQSVGLRQPGTAGSDSLPYYRSGYKEMPISQSLADVIHAGTAYLIPQPQEQQP